MGRILIHCDGNQISNPGLEYDHGEMRGRRLPGPSDHEGHFFGGDILRGDDEVAFVLAAGGIEDHDEFSSSCVLSE